MFVDWHLERLFSGLKTLGFELPTYFAPAYLLDSVTKLCKKNSHTNARIRITIIRGNGGLYDPENNFPNCIIQSWSLAEPNYQFNENGLVTGIYRQARKGIDDFSNIKSNNYLPYAMAASHAKKQHWNDAVLLNTSDTICDSTIANIFIVKDEQIITCPLHDGCIAGIMRRYLLESLPGLGFICMEQTLQPADLLKADEMFLTNAIRGIQWVKSCEESNFNNRISSSIFNKLLKKMD